VKRHLPALAVTSWLQETSHRASHFDYPFK